MRPIAAALVLLAGLLGPATPAQEGQGVVAVLELNQRFYYAGEPFRVRVSIGNNGAETVANPVKSPLFKGFRVEDAAGKPIEAATKASAEEPSRPGKLASNSFYGAVVDLTELYPALKKPGTYVIRWTSGGVESPTLTVQMIPKFDPSKDYRAVLETTQGPITIELFADVAPIAVKNFVDLAHAGFYDGLLFHEVRPDHLVVAGDPTGTGQGDAGYRYPAELSAVPVVSGSVLMKPMGPAPPANGSQFLIMMRPETRWTGQFTVFGHVAEGLSVARAISNVPSTGQQGPPFFRPREDVRIERVSITARARAARAPAGP